MTGTSAVTAVSAPNIALIKYWGNRNNELRLPAADSLSMCLSNPTVEVTVERSSQLAVHSFDVEGHEKQMDLKHIVRFQQTIEGAKRYLFSIGVPEAIPDTLSITVRSAIPPSIGLASSAAVFSALAEAIAGLAERTRTLTREEVSVIARLGSGSAARSVMDGFVALAAGTGDDVGSAKAVEIASAGHWMLYDIVIVPTKQEKHVGSTEGHAMAWSSPNFKKRLEELPERQRRAIEAIRHRDFATLQEVAEIDAKDMHEVMRTSSPSLEYLSPVTLKIVDAIEVYRKLKKLDVLYTMDAGPTVHLICTEESKDEVLHFAHNQQGCSVYVAHVGSGSKRLDHPHLA